MPKRPHIKFFIDECAPDSVGQALKDAGFEVTFLREALPKGSPDPLVAAASERSGAVLVSFDGDFRRLAPRIPVGRRRFQNLSRVWLRCVEPNGATRIKKVMPFIISEWRLSRKARDRRMIIQIGESYIRSER